MFKKKSSFGVTMFKHSFRMKIKYMSSFTIPILNQGSFLYGEISKSRSQPVSFRKMFNLTVYKHLSDGTLLVHFIYSRGLLKERTKIDGKSGANTEQRDPLQIAGLCFISAVQTRKTTCSFQSNALPRGMVLPSRKKFKK